MTDIFNRHTELEKRRELRRQRTPAEAVVWARVRNRQLLGHRFRFQYSVGPFVLDFYCPALRLAVEIDGPIHDGQAAQTADQERQKWIASLGLRFVRFSNAEILSETEATIARLVEAMRQREVEMARKAK